MRNIWLYGDGVRREQGFWAGIVADVQYLGRGAVRYAGLLPRMVVYLLPLAALAVLLTVVQFTVGRPYTLAVEVNGTTVGNVANETVFDAAREDVLQRVNYAGASATPKWPSSPPTGWPPAAMCWTRGRWPTPSSRRSATRSARAPPFT